MIKTINKNLNPILTNLVEQKKAALKAVAAYQSAFVLKSYDFNFYQF